MTKEEFRRKWNQRKREEDEYDELFERLEASVRQPSEEGIISFENFLEGNFH